VSYRIDSAPRFEFGARRFGQARKPFCARRLLVCFTEVNQLRQPQKNSPSKQPRTCQTLFLESKVFPESLAKIRFRRVQQGNGDIFEARFFSPQQCPIALCLSLPQRRFGIKSSLPYLGSKIFSWVLRIFWSLKHFL